MSMKDCLNQAVNDGRLRKGTADAAAQLFDELELELANNMHASQAAVEAARRTMEAVQFDRIERRRREMLQVKTWQKITKNLREYKNAKGEVSVPDAVLAHLDADQFANYSNLAARQKAVLGRLHGRMDEVLATFRRDLTGDVREKALLNDVARELHGVSTGSKSAKEMAQAWSDAAEFARQRYNAAGGSIPKRADWGMPQTHDSRIVRNTPYKEWRDFIMPKLDLAKMVDARTGLAFTPESAELALREVYETIRSEGLNKLKPNGRGSGKSLAQRRTDHRFLAFKSADDWLAYNNRFGGNDIFSTMMAHLDGMSRDIAALETLGPNPQSTLRYMEQVMSKDAAGPMTDAQLDKVSKASKLMWDMYGNYTGAVSAPVDGKVARSFTGLRNVLQSAQLGAATLSAITDLNFQRIARQMSGLQQKTILKEYVKLLNPRDMGDQKLAVRLGLIAENWATIASGQARYVGEVVGPEVSRRLSDIVMRVSGLSSWTQAGRWAFGMEFMGNMADNAGKAFDELQPALQKTMKKYGINADHWDIIRSTELYEHKGATFLRPDDIATRSDIQPSLADDLGMRVLEMIQSETEYAVPAVSLRGKSQMIGDTRPGSVQGELIRSFAMYKNFAATLLHTHIARIAAQKTMGGRAAMAGNLVLSATMMGALSLQLKEISNGRDPRPMNTPEFWGAALLQGGGLGIFGDFLFSDVNRFGGGLPQTIAGPVVGFLDDLRRLTLGNVMQLPGEEKTNFAAELTNFLKRYTPGGSLWYMRTAFERVILDNMRKWTDPDAEARFRRTERRWKKEFGQKFWWRPGESTPDRAPDLQNAVREK